MARIATNAGTPWLVVAGCLSLAAAAIHVAIIFGGPDWYRFFGAGERMARAAERGLWTAPAVTLGIATILACWGAYAFSGAGSLPRLPLLRFGLAAISAIYLLRALAPLAFALARPEANTPFMLWSSLVVALYAVVYAVGTWKAWPSLNA